MSIVIVSIFEFVILVDQFQLNEILFKNVIFFKGLFQVMEIVLWT